MIPTDQRSTDRKHTGEHTTTEYSLVTEDKYGRVTRSPATNYTDAQAALEHFRQFQHSSSFYARTEGWLEARTAGPWQRVPDPDPTDQETP